MVELITGIFTGLAGMGVVASMYVIYKISRMKEICDIRQIAVLQREQSDIQNGRYVLPIRVNQREKKVNLYTEIEKRALKSIGLFGQAGSGKSTALSHVIWSYSNLVECRRIGLGSPIKVFVFNYHRFAEGKGDFDNLGLEKIDIAIHLPSIFNPKYREILVRSFATVFVSQEMNSRGIMATMLEPIFREILELRDCKNWDEFARDAEQLSRNSSGLKAEVSTLVASKINALNTGTVKEIEFDLEHSLLLDYSNLPNELSQNLYSEFYANIIYKKAVDEAISGTPHSIGLAVDECHRLLQFSNRSIIANVLTEGRKYIRAWIASQNFTHVDVGARHFQHFQFKTHNDMDLKSIGEISALHADAMRQLNEKEFVWVNDGNTTQIPIYRIDITRMEAVRDYIREQQKNTVPVVTPAENVAVVPSVEVVELEDWIVELLGNSDFCMTADAITKALGYEREDNEKRHVQTRTLPIMIENDKMRLVPYVTATLTPDMKPRKYYYAIPKGISQIHTTLVSDALDVLKKIGVKAEEGFVNQGWDILTFENIFVDAKTGLEKDLKDDVERLQNETITPKGCAVVFVCPNYDVKKRYVEAFEVIDEIQNKYFVCCLNELVEIVRGLRVK